MRYFAFLRAVNVTGNNVLPMARLKTICTDLGFGGVQTLLASGNVCFEAKRKPSAAQISDGIRAAAGLNVKVMLRTEAELRSVVERNPFTPVDVPGHLLVFFLERPSAADRVPYTGPERIHIDGREAYVHFVNGQGRSKLTTALLERTFGCAATGRNWNTVNKLLQLGHR